MLQSEWASFVSIATEGQSNLVNISEQWKEYEEDHDELLKWMKVIEGQVKDYDLSATLQEKQAQVEKYKVSFHQCQFFFQPINQFLHMNVPKMY